jgi:O-antigen/teichoic acid export membrane protein
MAQATNGRGPGGSPDGLLGALAVAPATVFVSFAAGRVFGTVLAAAAARSLTTADFGRMSYALALAALAGAASAAAPMGLSRTIADGDASVRRREAYSNHLAAVILLAAAGAGAIGLLGPRLGLDLGLVVAATIAIVGAAARETYRETQRGLGRAAAAHGYGAAFGLLQLLAMLALSGLGWRSPGAFAATYGLAALAVPLVANRLRPPPVRLSVALLGGHRTLEVLRSLRSPALQALFSAGCLGLDLIAVGWLLGASAAGRYAAAKALAALILVAPSGIGFALLPGTLQVVARTPATARPLVRALGLAAGGALVAAAAFVLAGRSLIELIFGRADVLDARTLGVMAAGAALSGCATVLASLCNALRRPAAGTAAAGIAAAVTAVAALALVPPLGLEGAAWALTAGSALRLLLMGAYLPVALRLGALDEVASGLQVAPDAVAVLGEAGDEPSRSVASLTDALRRVLGPRPLLTATLPAPAGEGRPRRGAVRARRLLAAAGHAGRLGRRRVGTLALVSRAGCTLETLLIARLLKLGQPRSAVVLIALRAGELGGVRASAARRLWPDLVTATTEDERDRLRSLGARAELAGTTDELARLIAERARRRWRPAPAAAVLLVRARRALWRLEDRARVRFIGLHPGCELRAEPQGVVSLVEASSPAQHPEGRGASAPLPSTGDGGWAGPVRVSTSRVGLVASRLHSPSLSAALQTARLCGLEVVAAPLGGHEPMMRRAADEAWPLVVLSLDAAAPLTADRARPIAAFLEQGGTVLVTTTGGESSAALAELARAGLPPVTCRAIPGVAQAVYFSAAARSLTSVFAGARVETTEPSTFLEPSPGAEVVAWTLTAKGRHPALLQYRRGDGRLLVSAAADLLPTPLRECFVPRHALAVLPPMMLMRRLYGERVWHPPAPLANLSVDDPILRGGRLGLDYPRLLARVRELGVHLSVATIPGELWLAEPSVVHLLRSERRRMTACFHGSEHSGYEFYFPEAKGLRYRARPLGGQRSAVARACRRGWDFWERTGLALDRIMVFPVGVGCVDVLPALHHAGFLASCNLDDRDPLGAARPRDPWLRLRPADTAWADLPLLWRRGLHDPRTVFDLFLGRPALLTADLEACGPDLGPLFDRAAEVGRFAGASLRWSGLEEVARHAYLQREDEAGAWLALMTANEICLHNPTSRPRTYQVHRPHRPRGSALAFGDGQVSAAERVPVVVPARGSARVRLLTGSTPAIPAPGGRCAVFEVAP